MIEYFARVTENYDALGITIPPVAQYLHRMILRAGKPGTVVEIDLEEFQTWSAAVRNQRKGFSWKWIWKGVTSLIEKGLLEIVKKYNKRYLKVRAYYGPQDGKKSSHFRNQTSQNGHKTSQKTASNDANSSSFTESQRTTDTHYHSHPVVEENISQNQEETSQEKNVYQTEGTSPQRASVDDLAAQTTVKATTENLSEENNSDGAVAYDNTDTPQPEALTQEQKTLLRECEGEGIVLHPKMRAFILATETQIVRDALEALKVFKEKKRVKNPNGFLRRGIDERWQVTPTESSNSKPYSPEFYRWYSRVEKGTPGGIMDCPAEYLPTSMGEPMVRIDRQPEKGDAPYTLLPWREAALEFPVPESERPAPPPTPEPDDATRLEELEANEVRFDDPLTYTGKEFCSTVQVQGNPIPQLRCLKHNEQVVLLQELHSLWPEMVYVKPVEGADDWCSGLAVKMELLE